MHDPTGSSARRRSANDSTRAVDASSHCTSSIAITNGPDAASARTKASVASDTAR